MWLEISLNYFNDFNFLDFFHKELDLIFSKKKNPA